MTGGAHPGERAATPPRLDLPEGDLRLALPLIPVRREGLAGCHDSGWEQDGVAFWGCEEAKADAVVL
jgi:hypothetical protein